MSATHPIRLDGTLDPVSRLQVTITENGKEANPYEIQWRQKDMIREHVDCGNSKCFGGGFSLGDLLRELVSGRQDEYIGTSFCRGHEGDPEEPVDHPSCQTRFEVHVKLSFH